jgi:RNA polymerase sigma-70 factor, ECF subfamily
MIASPPQDFGRTMTSVGIEVEGSAEETVRRLLLGGVAGAYRLATCILRDGESAEDAVQEAALRAWARRHELRDPERAEAWFARIVVNVCRTELGRRAKNRALVEIGAYEPSAGVDESWVTREEVGLALARLTPDEQLVVALRYGRDFTVPQIAERTGIREGTVKSRLHNAQEHLRAALDAERRSGETLR